MLTVVLNCDVDPDRAVTARGYHELDAPSWKGIEEGIAHFEKFFQWSERAGRSPRVTWFLRSDERMQVELGDSAWPAGHFSDLWSARRRLGDSLGWHPHLWRRSDQGWFHERRDLAWIASTLKLGFTGLRRYYGFVASKMGFGFHTQYTMRIIDQLGIQVDLTALPGIEARDEGGVVYDWSRTDARPYRPSAEDYQSSREPFLRLLEVPNTTFSIPVVARLVRRLRKKFCRGYLDFWNPTKHPSYFQAAMKTVWARKDYWLVGYFHPDELLFTRGLFRGTYFARNLSSLARDAVRLGRSVRFLTADELLAEMREPAQ